MPQQVRLKHRGVDVFLNALLTMNAVRITTTDFRLMANDFYLLLNELSIGSMLTFEDFEEYVSANLLEEFGEEYKA